MKCKIPEISWHNRDPVLSVDIQPKTNVNNNYYRLASGGTDAHVLIWYMKLTCSGEDIELDLAADLARHQRAVNAVKWSPNGELLASGDDESVVFIWKLKSDSEPVNILDSTNEQDKEVWITLKVLRGHMEDIYDLSWAPNSMYLVSGSVDNSAMVWDVHKGKSLSILNDHKGFVQGVAWDPKNQYIATLSTDRYLRIFDIQTKKVLYRISKGTLPVAEDNNFHGKRMRLFHDDTLQTFFRRLTFTPDGKLLLTPAGVTDYDGCTRPINTTYAFSRYGFRQPAIVLPCPDQYTVAVKCCPILYKLRAFNADKNPPVVPLPYRMIFAVATKSSVYFYDTQQKQPFALISNIHYTRLTDITWSNDGRIVVVSSTDGFCSLITFEHGELGEEYENSEAVLEAALAQVTKKTKKQKDTDPLQKIRKPSTDDSVVTKETVSMLKEPQLEKVEEQDIVNITNPIEVIQKPVGEAVEIEDKLKENVTKQAPRAIAENNDKNNTKANPIAIKRKPGPVEGNKNQEEKNVEQIATPIAIKRNPGLTEKADKNDNKESPKKVLTLQSEKSTQDNTKANPMAVEGKPGPVEEYKNEDKNAEQIATPIAIKRKPGPIEISEKNDNKVTLKKVSTLQSDESTKDNTKANTVAIERKSMPVEEYKNKEKIVEQLATPIAIKRKSGPIETSDKNDSKETPKQVSTLQSEKSTPKDNTKANPIAIERKPGPVEEYKNKEKIVEQIATPIAIKCKSGPSEISDKNDKATPKEVSTLQSDESTPKDNTKANPIAIKRKPGPVEEYKNEDKKNAEQIATPIAIKRKPGPIEISENNDNKVTPKKVSTLQSDESTPKDNTKGNPIAIKRKPGPVEEYKNKEKIVEQIATPIAIKRKSGPIETSDKNDSKETLKQVSKLQSNESTPPKIQAVINSKVLASEIVIDKEILSSEEKFESPEKKSRPATPISVRRHPRTPSNITPIKPQCQTPTTMTNVLKTHLDLQNQSPLSSVSQEVKTPRQDKKATPIAVRRAPRAIITTPSVVAAPSMIEEAMDAWPISNDSNPEGATFESSAKKPLIESGIAPLPISDTTCERTEDIRLVYEETNEEVPVKVSLPKPIEIEKKPTDQTEKDTEVVTPQQQTPSGKTPRRVALKTISTPKSKKKLLD